MGREGFSYRITKDEKALVYWYGRHGRREIILNGKRPAGLTAKLPGIGEANHPFKSGHSTRQGVLEGGVDR